MSLLDLVRALKGGAGSGNFGHSGRPGKIGGSSGGEGLLGLGEPDLIPKYWKRDKKNQYSWDSNDGETHATVAKYGKIWTARVWNRETSQRPLVDDFDTSEDAFNFALDSLNTYF